ncbi:MAG: hypothetical protein EA406_09315 [Rhodospirillales bacterium]|nr:MAG: hypothetical protein EA406_09315 [Rhodospirillales bacterium]
MVALAPESSSQPLQPQDIHLITVLGTVSEAAASLPAIIAGSRSLAAADWQPTSEPVANCLARAEVAGLVAEAGLAPTGTEPLFTITERGRQALKALLVRSIPSSPGGFVRTCRAAKLRFLGHLDPMQQAWQLKELGRQRRAALDEIFGARTIGTMDWRVRSGWIRHEIEQIEREINWLDRIAADGGCRVT